MRRRTSLRNENQVSTLIAEVERLKGLMSKITDGHELVQVVAGSGGTTIPPETSQHIVYGDKHTKNLRVSQLGTSGNDVQWEGGQVWQDGVFTDISAGTSIALPDPTNYVNVIAGSVVVGSVAFPNSVIPMAIVTVAGGEITGITDRRAYLSQTSHLFASPSHADILDNTPATGDLLYYGGAGWTNATIGSEGHVLQVVSGVPEFASIASSGSSGYQERNVASSDLNPLPASLAYADISGCSVTLPNSGDTYLVIGKFAMECTTATTSNMILLGILTNAANDAQGQPAVVVKDSHDAGDVDNTVGVWLITTSGDNEVYKLRAAKSGSNGVFKVEADYTEIFAHSLGNIDHVIADHTDTTATGAELEALTDGTIGNNLHGHSILKQNNDNQIEIATETITMKAGGNTIVQIIDDTFQLSAFLRLSQNLGVTIATGVLDVLNDNLVSVDGQGAAADSLAGIQVNSGTPTGKEIVFLNAVDGVARPITIKHQDTEAAAELRIILDGAADYVMDNDGAGIVLVYDDDEFRWREVGRSGSGGSDGSDHDIVDHDTDAIGAELDTLTAGVSSDADALHTHDTLGGGSGADGPFQNGEGFTTLTIASGAVTRTGNAHFIEPQADTDPIDDLVTMSGGGSGEWVLIVGHGASDVITIKNGISTNNFLMLSGGDLDITSSDYILFRHNGTFWVESLRSVGLLPYATAGETTTGSAADRAVTPDGLNDASPSLAALTVRGGTYIGGAGASFNIAFTIESPTAAEKFMLFFGFAAFTIQEVQLVLIGSSTPTLTVNLEAGTSMASLTKILTDTSSNGDGVDITSVTTGHNITGFVTNEDTVPTDSYLVFTTDFESGTVTQIHGTIRCTWD